MKDHHVEVAGYPNLVRDTTNGVILNTDKASVQKAVAAKKAKKEQEERLSAIEGDLKEIKTALNALLKTYK
jgi:hypothetical protein